MHIAQVLFAGVLVFSASQPPVAVVVEDVDGCGAKFCHSGGDPLPIVMHEGRYRGSLFISVLARSTCKARAAQPTVLANDKGDYELSWRWS